ncbi:MAG: 6-carboxytetrahydropterin synthase [Bacteroidales bacterium]|nr:6-carboxytetrahydropterin synthase [Bacteroidales bacterium]
MKIRVTKEFTFDCAHALFNYNGLCKNIHGHTYKLFVTVIGNIIEDVENQSYGMIIDFSQLKSIVKNNIVDIFDHSLILSNRHRNPNNISDFQEVGKYIEFEGQATCENMVSYFAKVLIPILPKEVELFSIKLYETPTSFAEWFASDN